VYKPYHNHQVNSITFHLSGVGKSNTGVVENLLQVENSHNVTTPNPNPNPSRNPNPDVNPTLNPNPNFNRMLNFNPNPYCCMWKLFSGATNFHWLVL